MFTEQKLEQHYASIPSDALHIIRDEYKWALEECGVHNEEQIKYIEKRSACVAKACLCASTAKSCFCANAARAAS